MCIFMCTKWIYVCKPELIMTKPLHVPLASQKGSVKLCLLLNEECPENVLMTVYSITSATAVFKPFERKPFPVMLNESYT